ncbi:hypothetical protein IHV10_22350 [Fictibacillus sp. 5RED26]|uniref:hypothetical protein n=1 Tax=Fictibacillus sp. 5RED26 TaxID=2745876 RepID=UPI0018CFE6B6|nr:hypothetical protein [Fictibacillus sp. 5RED26]MBH0159115.1 hypothetical protein [Fictibacillus sp. 5RED26]
MSSNKWALDFKDIEILEEKMKQIPGRSEQAINDVLHGEGVNIVVREIQPQIPVSTWKNRVRKKKHARHVTNPQSSKKENLGFTIRPKPKFNYLKYPDLGIGKSKRNEPQHFMNKGLQKASPIIIEKLNDALDKTIKESLGGN